MIHPNTELRFVNELIGYGVFAREFIPAGTIIWVQDQLDRELSPEEFNQLPPVCRDQVENHTFRNRKGNYILCWDLGKYINHSFKSNCLATAYDFEIAIRDIQPGEELTDDYGYLNIIAPFEAADEGTARKVVYPDDLLRYHELWDAQLRLVFGKIIGLGQPLRSLISAETWAHLEEVAKGDAEMMSIRDNFFDTAAL